MYKNRVKPPSILFYCQYLLNGSEKFYLDTGAKISIIMIKRFKKHKNQRKYKIIN